MIKDVNFWIAIANATMALTAIFAACLARKQLKSTNTETRKATAHAIYDDYLTLCFNHPLFSYGDQSAIKKNGKDYEQYRWFIAKMLFAFEQILDVMPENQQWNITIKNQLSRHSWHLINSHSIKRKEWNNNLQKLLSEVINQETT